MDEENKQTSDGSTKRMEISVIIPVFNESRIIAATAKTLSDYMMANYTDYEIIFVNDGCTDQSEQVLNQLALPQVRVIGYHKNMGKGYAVKTGMLAAKGDIRMFTDADLAYGTEVIKRITEEYKKDRTVSVVTGSRNLCNDGYDGYSILRKAASKIYMFVIRIFCGGGLTDSQCGCKSYKAEAADAVFSRCEVNGFAFDFETILWARKLGYQRKEIPVRIINHGASKVRIVRDSLKMLIELVKMKIRIMNSEV